ncbi:hypothetical protein A8A54_10010 [Brucella pseudogrignonensis]|uniref:cold shock domain-containing protein n=1 Tax=Brucella pseudogrignonensis TaxID=419475 RepID=UPI0007DA5F57|nr:cold shock domain-containing protein [Brucella pseudogrignonensis]ANG96775.1 hypothetical protein A8A54_10010 [Brucella pseudogrignonensis]
MPVGNLFSYGKNFGFLKTDQGRVFVHGSAFALAGLKPELGSSYLFVIGEHNGRPTAVHLKSIDAAQ